MLSYSTCLSIFQQGSTIFKICHFDVSIIPTFLSISKLVHIRKQSCTCTFVENTVLKLQVVFVVPFAFYDFCHVGMFNLYFILVKEELKNNQSSDPSKHERQLLIDRKTLEMVQTCQFSKFFLSYNTIH